MSFPRSEEAKWLIDFAKQSAAAKQSNSVTLAYLVDSLMRNYPPFLEARLENDYNQEFLTQFWNSLNERVPDNYYGNVANKRLDNNVKSVLRNAERIARSTGHRELDVGHIAIAALQNPSVYKMMCAAGASVRELRQAWGNCHLLMSGAHPDNSEAFRARQRVFVPNISVEQQARLSTAGVPFQRGRLAGVAGVFIPSDFLNTAATELSLWVFVRIDTRWRWLQQAVLRPQVTAVVADMGRRNVHYRNANYRARYDDRLRRVVGETIQPVVGTSVEILVGHGESVDPDTEADFRLIAYSSAVDEKELAPPTLFGIATDPNLPFFKPSGLGTVFTDPNGTPYAELVDNNLYLLFPLEEDSGDKDIQLAMFAMAADAFARQGMDATPEDSEFAAAGHKLTHFRLFGAQGTLAISLAREVLTTGGMDCSIHLMDCGGEVQQRIDDGKFYIFVDAHTPHGQPKGTGVPVLIEGDAVAAELFGSNLYIYGQPFSRVTTREAARYSKILRAAKDQFAVSRGLVTPEMVADRFAAECMKQLKIEEPVQEVAEDGAAVQQAETRLLELNHNAQRIEYRMLNLDSEAEEMLGREFDALTTMEKVREVRVDEDEVVVSTDVIYCTNPKTGWRHRLGRFNIRLKLVEPYEVRFLNENPIRWDGHWRHAPHVIDDGQPCLGNVQDLFPQMLQSRNLTQAVQLAIAYLESVNPDDTWGRSVGQWPVERD